MAQVYSSTRLTRSHMYSNLSHVCRLAVRHAARHTCTLRSSSSSSSAARLLPLACHALHTDKQSPLVVLGIESSCDDTAAAVVSSDGRVLGEALATQADLHAAWGGVVPSIAQEAHRDAIDRIVDAALSQAALSIHDLDAIAVTIGPGLSLCLDVGVRKARSLSRESNKPLVPIHHMEAHALVARMAAGGSQALPFPFLCLLVSGGHNLLVLVKGVGDYMQLGTTLDDALGEAYDKVARMLGLDLNPNGGAAVEALAKQGNPHAYQFAVPMKKHANCDFSYAGLKTSVRLCIERLLGSAGGVGKRATNVMDASSSIRDHSSSHATANGSSREASSTAGSSKVARTSSDSGSSSSSSSNNSSSAVDAAAELQIKADIAASFQRVAVEHLVMRLKRAISWAQQEAPQLQHVVVAGGVASNQYIRQRVEQVAESAGLQLVVPPPRWCTDNGVMVGWAGIERYRLGLIQPPPPPVAEDITPEWIELRPRWPLTSHKHSNSMPPTLSMKRPGKQAVSLTDLTQEELRSMGQGQETAAAASSPNNNSL